MKVKTTLLTLVASTALALTLLQLLMLHQSN